MYDNPETVEFVSLGDHTEPAYTATINKRLLTRLSPYFKVLFEGGFKESTMESFSIDLSGYLLGNFEQWMCTGKIEPTGVTFTETHWLELFSFADYYDIPAFRRAIMLRFASPYDDERFVTRVSEWQLGSCLAELPTTSPFYLWLVEHWAHCNKQRLGRKMRQNEDIPQKLRDAVLDRARDGFDSRPCKCCRHPCDFHEHESEEEWKETCYLLNNKVRKPDPSTYRKPLSWP